MFPGTRVNSLRSRIDVPRSRRSVVVDNQSKIVLPNDDGIERFSDQAANRADADVPGNVTLAFGIGKAELSKPPRKMLPRVIAGLDGEDAAYRGSVANRAWRALFAPDVFRRAVIFNPTCD